MSLRSRLFLCCIVASTERTRELDQILKFRDGVYLPSLFPACPLQVLEYRPVPPGFCVIPRRRQVQRHRPASAACCERIGGDIPSAIAALVTLEHGRYAV